MATATELFEDRDTAGAAYASAVAALKTAWINLRALDLACQNDNVLKAHPLGAQKRPVDTFPNASEWGGRPLHHPIFVPMPEVVEWDAAAWDAAKVHINGLSS